MGALSMVSLCKVQCNYHVIVQLSGKVSLICMESRLLKLAWQRQNQVSSGL